MDKPLALVSVEELITEFQKNCSLGITPEIAAKSLFTLVILRVRSVTEGCDRDPVSALETVFKRGRVFISRVNKKDKKIDKNLFENLFKETQPDHYKEWKKLVLRKKRKAGILR